MHRRIGIIAAAHVEPAVADHTVDVFNHIDSERLQEDHVTQSHYTGTGTGRKSSLPRSTRHLEVASGREYDAGLHDMVSHKNVQSASHWRAESRHGITDRWQASLHEWVRPIKPWECAPTHAEWRRRRCGQREGCICPPQYRMSDRAAVPK
jgi:hypothetical protein